MKMKNEKRHWVLAIGVLFAMSAMAQKVTLTPEQYQDLKASGSLPASFDLLMPAQTAAATVSKTPADHGTLKGGGGGFNNCNCWIQPDADYTLAMGPNDDFSSGLISIPFQFNLYGDLYSNLYINNNGNVSFDAPWGTFTANPFPTASFAMVAPFWADIDTRGDDGLGLNGGTVKYKITPTALYVNWDDCGYFSMHTDKKVFIQLIITDGTDPVIGIGKNVSFCYKEMDWTTGDASSGINGFGGSPAVVGANRGNGVDFIQFGTFDQPGSAYDGPFGAPDGIDWLDTKNFVFTTSVSTANVPPIASGSLLCDTLVVCTGELVDLEMSFISPETGQTTVATSSAPTLSTYNELSNTSGLTAVITSQFQPTTSEVGFHNIHYEATDDGTPPLTTIIDIVVNVVLAPSSPPVITGDTVACEGVGVVLTASGGFDNYLWSNGYNGASVLVGPGTYTVEAGAGSCILSSNTITVTEIPSPDPVITGVLFNCGGEPTELSTTEPYANYTWSTGSTAPTITVGTGTYSVIVTDANGCEGMSATVNVLTADNPTAGATAFPASPADPPADVTFTDASNGNGGTITGYEWTINGNVVGNNDVYQGTLDPGVYTVTITVTTSDGCTDSYTFTYIVGDVEIEVPNVFSPNNDGYNDELVFTGLEYYPNADLKVYSRWGNIVYESTSYNNRWKAKDVSDGTYYFILALADGRDYHGHVTIVR